MGNTLNAGGAWSSPLTSISAQVKNAWLYTTTPPYVFMACCFNEHVDNWIYLLHSTTTRTLI
jgi:hypothetical protein